MNGRAEADEKNAGKAALFPSASETINSHTLDAACAAAVSAPAAAAACDQASPGDEDDLC